MYHTHRAVSNTVAPDGQDSVSFTVKNITEKGKTGSSLLIKRSMCIISRWEKGHGG